MYAPAMEFDGRMRVEVFRVLGVGSSCLEREPARDFHLASADGYAGDGAAVVLGEVARCAADAAADVEYGGIFREGGAGEEESD